MFCSFKIGMERQSEPPVAQQVACADVQLQLGTSRVRRSRQFITASGVMKTRGISRNLANHRRLQLMPAFAVAALGVVCTCLAVAATIHIIAFQCNHFRIRSSRSPPQRDNEQHFNSWNHQGKIRCSPAWQLDRCIRIVARTVLPSGVSTSPN